MSTNGNNKVPITCPHCKQSFSVTMPKPTVMNELRASVAVATHEKPIRCICGKFFVFIIENVQVSWAIIPISDEQGASLMDSNIIVPPPGSISLINGN